MNDSLKYVRDVAKMASDLAMLIDSASPPMDINEVDFITWKRLQESAKKSALKAGSKAVEAEVLLKKMKLD